MTVAMGVCPERELVKKFVTTSKDYFRQTARLTTLTSEGTLNQMFPTKLLGVDGMPTLFYQKYQDVVGNDVMIFNMQLFSKIVD